MLNYLFIGNSFTFYQDIYEIFAEIAHRAAKTEVHSVFVGRGGHTLLQFADPEDQYGAKMREILKGDVKFDRIIIQEQSCRPMIDYEKFRDGLKGVLACIRETQPEARVSLYSTGGYRDEHPKMAEFGMNSDEMEAALFDAYSRAGAEFGLPVTRVGKAFLRLYRETQINPYGDDKKHPSFIGSYLSALTHFYTEFPEVAEEAEYCHHLPSTVSGQRVREIAYEVAHFK